MLAACRVLGWICEFFLGKEGAFIIILKTIRKEFSWPGKKSRCFWFVEL